MHTGFWWENLKKRGHLEDIVIDDTVMLNCFLKERKWQNVDWICLPRDRGVSNRVTNLLVP
jgi:hypothetical protein